MRRVFHFLFLGFTLARLAAAGNVYGTLREGNKPLSGASVVMTCGKERVPGKTDTEGVYRVFARATGACQLLVDLRPLDLRVEGNKVLVRQHTQARGVGSGINLDMEHWTVWTFDADLLVTRAETYLPHQESEALEAAGLRE